MKLTIIICFYLIDNIFFSMKTVEIINRVRT